MACLKGISQVRDPSRLGPWLYRVAIRQVLQYRRAAGRRRAFQERYAAEAAPSEVQQQDALQWLLNSETGQLTRQAVERLPELDAQMFFLKYEHQLSYRDIAERLGISRNAVESRLHRIRKQLRRELCRQGIASESSGRATSKAGAD